MDLQTQIRQQQSTVQMLEKLIKAQRCRQAELDQANRRLLDLQEQFTLKPIVEKYPVLKVYLTVGYFTITTKGKGQ